MHSSYTRNGLGGLFLLAAMGASTGLGGCDDKKETPAARPAAASASAQPEAPPPPPADKIPDISVDNQGLYMGGERVVLSAPDGPRRLKETVGKYKLDGKSVVIVALRVARTPEVSAVVKALADAGVADLTLRTQDRAKHDTNLKILPEKKLGKLPECTVVTMMLKDRTTASWSIRGGTAIKYPKGMAGPDMSQTLEGVTKQVNACPSTTLLFAGDDTIEWGLTFDLATKVSMAEPPLKIVSYGLLTTAPVAGRPVKVTDPLQEKTTPGLDGWAWVAYSLPPAAPLLAQGSRKTEQDTGMAKKRAGGKKSKNSTPRRDSAPPSRQTVPPPSAQAAGDESDEQEPSPSSASPPSSEGPEPEAKASAQTAAPAASEAPKTASTPPEATDREATAAEREAAPPAPDSLAPTISPVEEPASPAPPAAASQEEPRAKSAQAHDQEPASRRSSGKMQAAVDDDEAHEDFFKGADAVVEKMKAEARKAAQAAEAIETPVVIRVTAEQLARRAQFRRVVMGVVALAGLLALGMLVQIATAPKQSALAMHQTPPMPKGPPIPTAVVTAEPPAKTGSGEAHEGEVADPSTDAAPATSGSAAPAASASAPAASASAEAAASAAPSAAASAAPAASAAAAASGAAEGAAAEGPKDPEQAKALTKSALAMLERGNNKGAIETAEASVAADPTDAAAYLYWGTALMEIGKQGEAKKVFARCVAEATRGPKNDCRQFR
jgi:hypothetical protein